MNWESRVCPSGTSLVQERDSGPFCRTHVPSPPEQRNLWEPEPDGSAPWPVIFPAIAWTLSMSKKITTLPGNLFHCWTPLVTRKDDRSSSGQSLLGLPIGWPRASQSWTKFSSSFYQHFLPSKVSDQHLRSTVLPSPILPLFILQGFSPQWLSCTSNFIFASASQGLWWIHHPRTFESCL